MATTNIAKKVLGESEIIEREREDKNMKESTTLWQKIKNGIKRAITFVIDVLLFIPRALFHGLCAEVAYMACKYIGKGREDDDDSEISYGPVEVKVEKSLTKKEEQQTKAAEKQESKEAKAVAREEKREAKAAAKEARKEAKAEAKEATKAKKHETKEVVEEVKTETTEVIEEANAEDTQTVEEVKTETDTEEKMIAAGETQPNLGVVPESVEGEVVQTTPAEVVETNPNASNTNADASSNSNNVVSAAADTTTCKHEHHHGMRHEHIHALRLDDIGVNELRAFDGLMCAKQDRNKLYNLNNNFAYSDMIIRYLAIPTQALLVAWCARLGLQIENMPDTPDAYASMSDWLEQNGELTHEEAWVLKSRSGSYLCCLAPDAHNALVTFEIALAKYYKRFYGTWVMYEEEFTQQINAQREFLMRNKYLPRLTNEEAMKYFPFDESLKGITREAPFVLGTLKKQC